MPEFMTGSDPRLSILISYFYFADVDLEKLLPKHFSPPYPRIFVDSGAFSAYSLGKPIDIGAYADWLHKNAPYIEAYASLDDKSSVKTTVVNLRYLERRGLSPLPVWHGGETLGLLDDYCAAYPYICLGNIAGNKGYKDPAVKKMLVAAFKMGAGRSVFHGFGVTAPDALRDFPWYSVDSTSWCAGRKFGRAPYYDPKAKTWGTAKIGDTDGIKRIASVIRGYGLDPMDIADRARYTWPTITRLAAFSYRRMEADLRTRHGLIYLPRTEQSDPGLHIYLGDTDSRMHQSVDRLIKEEHGLPRVDTHPLKVAGAYL